MSLVLAPIGEDYVVHRFPADHDIPMELLEQRGLLSVTRTADELSVVCSAQAVVAGSSAAPRAVSEKLVSEKLSAYRVVGTLDFSLTGILHELTGPLALAGISIFAISTYDTDYLLVPATAREAAERAWLDAGIGVQRPVVVAAAIVRDNAVMAARRTQPPEVAGRWECPGGKVEDGEAETDALEREIREEFGIEIAVGDRVPGAWPLGETYELHVYLARIVRGEPETLDHHDALAWVPVDAIDSVDWLEQDRDAMAAVAKAISRPEGEAPRP